MLEAELDRDALGERRIEAQVLLDLGQSEEDQREQLALGDLEVEQPAELLHQLAGGEHLRLVDEDHGLLARLVNLDEALVELAEQRELVLARGLDAELQGDALEQPGSGDAAVDDDEQRGLVLGLGKRVEQPSRERRLPRADVSDEDAEALHLAAQVRQPHQRLRVLRRVEVEAGDGSVGKGLLGQLVVVEIVHESALR